MVSPDVLVVGVEGDTVFSVHHHSEVAQLHVLARSAQYAEAVECGIIAHTLDGDVHVLSLTFHLQTDGRAAQCIHIGFLQLTDDADCKRTGLCSLLIGLQNVLNASSGLLILAHAHAELNGLCIVFADVDYASAVLQRTIVVVGSNACYSIVVGIAVTIESLHYYTCSFAALRGILAAV